MRRYLPSMANSNTVLLTFVAAELLVIAYELTLPDSNLVSFALHSLGVQWTVLLGLAMMSLGIRMKFAPEQAYSWFKLYGLFVLAAALVAYSYQLVFWFAGLDANWWRAFKFVIVAMIAAAVVARFLFMQYLLQHKQHTAAEAKMQSLQARIRPHFLFNSLNSAIGLIPIDPEQAETLLLNFTHLLRQTLSDPSQTVPLRQELDLCNAYLDIERVRFAERLQITIDIEPGLEELSVPLLCLQPVIENAVIHGVEPNPEGGKIRVTIKKQYRKLYVHVVNTVGAESIRTGHGIAQQNIRDRLFLLYEEQARYRASLLGTQFEVEMMLPLVKTAEP